MLLLIPGGLLIAFVLWLMLRKPPATPQSIDYGETSSGGGGVGVSGGGGLGDTVVEMFGGGSGGGGGGGGGGSPLGIASAAAGLANSLWKLGANAMDALGLSGPYFSGKTNADSDEMGEAQGPGMNAPLEGPSPFDESTATDFEPKPDDWFTDYADFEQADSASYEAPIASDNPINETDEMPLFVTPATVESSSAASVDGGGDALSFDFGADDGGDGGD